jgi:hypothetical protein
MSIPPADVFNFDHLRLVVEHVFMPPNLPQEDPGEQIEREMNVALCDNLIGAARYFLQDIPPSQHPLWKHMIKMMDLARRAAGVPFTEAELQRVFSDMAIGGMSISLRFFTPSIRLFSIRRFFHAYSRTECCSHCAPAFHR